MSRWAAFWARRRGQAVPPTSIAGRTAVARACAHCAHFRNDPADIEAALPGLASLSSGSGSVRSDDGLCLKHDRFVTMGSSCSVFRMDAGEG